MTGLPLEALNKMIDVVKEIEPEMGYGPIMKVSETEAKMREERVKQTKTVCTYCGVGCSYDVWTKGRKILKIEPLHGDANQISTCVKGKFGWDYVNDKDRLQRPLIREGTTFREASWEEALELVTRRLSEIKVQHGPDAIGVVVSSKTTNEDGYVMQKLARQVIGTNNVDNCSAGARYDRLEGYNTLQWPIHEDGTDEPILYLNGFAFPDKKARLFPLKFREPSDQPDSECDLFLNNGRQLEHFHEGNMTHRVAGIHLENPERYVEISSELAAQRGITTGRWVRLVSRHGAVKVKALVTDRVFGKQVYLPLSSQERPINVLTGSQTDAATNTPVVQRDGDQVGGFA